MHRLEDRTLKRSILFLAASFVLTGASLGLAAPAGLVHGTAHHVRRIANTTGYATNWAGYAATGAAGDFSNMSANWNQPAVTCASGETSYSSYWVGLDGYNSRTVEQIGTASDCQNGTPSYYAWYEMYPKFGAVCSLTVSAGDAIAASVAYDGNSGQMTLKLVDDSNTCTTTAKATGSMSRSSAEVIVEAPSSNNGPGSTLGLADFGTINFNRATVDGAKFAKSSPDEIIMGTTDSVKAQPTSLAKGHFSVTWESAS
jgi:hypothetical protein